MAFDPDSFLASSGTTGGFDPDRFLKEDNYWGDVKKNAVEGLKQWPQAAESMADQGLKIGRAMMPGQLLESGIEAIQGKPIGETPAGEGAKALYDAGKGAVHGIVQGVQDTGSLVKAPFQWLNNTDLADTDIGKKFRERPLSTPAGVVGTVLPAVKGLRGLGAAEEVAAGLPKEPPVGIADDLVKLPKEEPTVGATQIPPPPGEPGIPPPEPPPSGPGTPPQGGKFDPLGEMEQAFTEKYGRAQKTAGIPQNLGKSLVQKARGSVMKQVGASPGQVRHLRDRFGEQMVNDLSDLAKQKGITKGFYDFQTGEAITNMDRVGGQELGILRDLAVKRGAAGYKDALIAEIRNQLDPVYTKGGTASVHKGAYLKALKDLANSKDDAQSIANTITNTNKFVAGEKLLLPLSATRKVMGLASKLNNEYIGKHLNPQEIVRYEDNLKNVAAAKIFNKMHGFPYGRTMAGRTGPSGLWNFIKDVGGTKVMENVYSKVGRSLQKMTGNLPPMKTLSADVLEAVDEALNEMIDEMGTKPPEGKAFGGIVGEMDNYLTPRYGGTQ